MPTHTPSIDQLKRALAISEQIQALEVKLASVLGNRARATGPSSSKTSTAKPAKGKRTMSPEAREKIAAAQRARWAKSKGTASTAKATKAPRKTGGLTPQGRARLAAAMKARWAARKKGAPALNAPSASPKSGTSRTAKKAKRTLSPEARQKMAEAAKRRWAKVKG